MNKKEREVLKRYAFWNPSIDTSSDESCGGCGTPSCGCEQGCSCSPGCGGPY